MVRNDQLARSRAGSLSKGRVFADRAARKWKRDAKAFRMNAAARQVIAALKLEPLPQEGGYFRATWRNEHASAIYFLITPNDFSAFHRLAQDEMWHFYAGDPVEHVQLDPKNYTSRISLLGPNISAGQFP